MSYQSPPPPTPYGAPGPYGGGAPQKTSVMAIISLVSGVIGLPCCGCVVFGLAAIVLGLLGRKEINQSAGATTGSGLATAGLVLGVISVLGAILYYILIAAGTIDVNYYTDLNS